MMVSTGMLISGMRNGGLGGVSGWDGGGSYTPGCGMKCNSITIVYANIFETNDHIWLISILLLVIRYNGAVQLFDDLRQSEDEFTCCGNLFHLTLLLFTYHIVNGTNPANYFKTGSY